MAETDLSFVDLSGATCITTHLVKVNLTGAKLDKASLDRTSLLEATVTT